MAIRRRRATDEEVTPPPWELALVEDEPLEVSDLPETDLITEPVLDPFEYRVWEEAGTGWWHYEVKRKDTPEWVENSKEGRAQSFDDALAAIGRVVESRRNQLRTERNKEAAEWLGL